MSDRYVCRVCKEDLTDLVKAMRDANDVVTAQIRVSRFSLETASGTHRLEIDGDKWKVLAKCTNGHDNVFRG